MFHSHPSSLKCFHSFNPDLTLVVESQEKELESRRSSMMTPEVPLTELNYERAAKNEEIQKLKGQLNEKEMVRMECQAVLDEFYAKQNQLAQNGNTNGLTSQESLLAQSQTSVQELRNRCLEVSRKEPDQERLLHVRRTSRSAGVTCLRRTASLWAIRTISRGLSTWSSSKKNTKLKVVIIIFNITSHGCMFTFCKCYSYHQETWPQQ